MQRKELLYALILFFVILTVFMVGQINAMMFVDYVRSQCPAANITFYSPFTVSFTVPNATVPVASP